MDTQPVPWADFLMAAMTGAALGLAVFSLPAALLRAAVVRLVALPEESWPPRFLCAGLMAAGSVALCHAAYHGFPGTDASTALYHLTASLVVPAVLVVPAGWALCGRVARELAG